MRQQQNSLASNAGFLISFFAGVFLFDLDAFAAKDSYPNITGKVLFESRTDRVLSTDKDGVSSTNSIVNAEPHFILNLDKNWSVKTDWRYSPFYTRDQDAPERFRQILSDNRSLGISNNGLYVEQLRGEFANDDMKFFFGKFNPTFGSAWKRDKRLGVFTADFTRDYELRGKMGLGGAALLEKSEVNLSGFFNDVTGLSNTAINSIGRESTNDNVAGNTSTLSSYTVTMDGKDFFDVSDLTYNLGYSRLATNKMAGRADQTGYVAGFEYLIPVGLSTYLIPFVEIAKINNMSGESDRNALYTTASLRAKYAGWLASLTRMDRNIRQKNQFGNYKDYQNQLTIGYKFRSGISVDVSRAKIREAGYTGSLVGLLVSYVYEF
jgi:hypothetical protein